MSEITVEAGRFGKYGGRYVPESLVSALEELDAAYEIAKNDPQFQEELMFYYKEFAGRPSMLYRADRISEQIGATVYLKREDLNHTGAHKINNTIGQALLARRMGKKRIIAETGAGQHGVATATVAALFGMECVVYMGAEDVRRQALNVFRMELLGTKVVPVHEGSATLKDAINEALRDWMETCDETHYILGSVCGPHPFPVMVRDFQKIIGEEARAQCLEREGRLPTHCLACVGGGSNAMGLFHAFIPDEDVKLIGVEAAGRGLDTDQHCASIMLGTEGVLHGALSLVLQDDNGQVIPSYSVAAGLDYPAVGPEHAYLHSIGRAEYIAVTDEQALDAFMTLSRLEGVIPALESSHALAGLYQIKDRLQADSLVIVNLSGRGDKDCQEIQQVLEQRK